MTSQTSPPASAECDAGPDPASISCVKILTHSLGFKNRSLDDLVAFFVHMKECGVHVIIGQGVTKGSRGALQGAADAMGYEVCFSHYGGTGHGHNYVAHLANRFELLKEVHSNLGDWGFRSDKYMISAFCRDVSNRHVYLFGAFHTPGSLHFSTDHRVAFAKHAIDEFNNIQDSWNSVAVNECCRVICLSGKCNLTDPIETWAARFTHRQSPFAAHLHGADVYYCLPSLFRAADVHHDAMIVLIAPIDVSTMASPYSTVLNWELSEKKL